jgi:hypothetical protein
MEIQNILWWEIANKMIQFNTLFNNNNNMSGGEAL